MVSSQRAGAGREETYQWRQSNWLLEKLESTADSRACAVHQRHGAATHVPGRPTGPLSGAVSRLACCSPLSARRSLAGSDLLLSSTDSTKVHPDPNAAFE